jgi:hypothetical protein
MLANLVPVTHDHGSGERLDSSPFGGVSDLRLATITPGTQKNFLHPGK